MKSDGFVTNGCCKNVDKLFSSIYGIAIHTYIHEEETLGGV